MTVENIIDAFAAWHPQSKDARIGSFIGQQMSSKQMDSTIHCDLIFKKSKSNLFRRDSMIFYEVAGVPPQTPMRELPVHFLNE